MEDRLQQLHGVFIQAAKIAHSAIKLNMRIADVELGEFWCFAKLRK
jgi:hypothetical protein